jgi:hypothetical protein
MKKPLLIRLGTAFNPDNHNSPSEPAFLKNFSLCNPCFAINKEMAYIYLHYLKIIDYHSDVYFHQKIPKNIPGIQYFTMYPYPVFELSFVKEKQKFESTIRPTSELRRIEYKDFLLLSSNILLTTFLKNFSKILNINLSDKNINYHGNINSYILLNEKDKNKYFFENKFLIIDDYETDIQIIYQNLILKNNYIYESYLNKINDIYNINLKLNINEEETLDDVMEKIKIFYNYYIRLMTLKDIIIININKDENRQFLSKYIEDKTINKLILQYNYYKKKFLQGNHNEIDNENLIEDLNFENEEENNNDEEEENYDEEEVEENYNNEEELEENNNEEEVEENYNNEEEEENNNEEEEVEENNNDEEEVENYNNKDEEEEVENYNNKDEEEEENNNEEEVEE